MINVKIIKKERNINMANSNFYANIGVNAGFTRSRSNTSSHTEGVSVTTLKPMDENSSIAYSNVNNITYQGTQAQGGTFICNNVANIQKESVELHNSYSSSSSSRGINAGQLVMDTKYRLLETAEAFQLAKATRIQLKLSMQTETSRM